MRRDYRPTLKTRYALDLIRLTRCTPYRAAKLAGISLSTMYRALAKLKTQNPGQ